MSDRKMLVALKENHPKVKFAWFYGVRCRPGVKFYLESPAHFSGEWMDLFEATDEQLAQVPEKYRKGAMEALGRKPISSKPVAAPVGNSEVKTSPMEPGTLVRRGPGRPNRVAEPK